MEKPRLTVFIAGGAGRLGSAVVVALLGEGHRVIVYDNLTVGTRESVQAGAKFIFGDIRDPHLIPLVFKMEKVDLVIHLANLGEIGAVATDAFSVYDVNVLGTLNLLRAAVRQNIRKFIVISGETVTSESPFGSSQMACQEILQVARECHDISIAT
ncbi:MAG: NAD-dependent epimerase/dehydratase family protein, partial [Bdellovibrionaceae bacterium]|nr:NAD-dependent epimerase/dehydratase family protein [Pseudobdellovibrionaceae bacterium]